MCESNTFGVCTPDFAWDASPDVCGCAPRECDDDYDPCIAATCAVGNDTGPGGACIQIACADE